MKRELKRSYYSFIPCRKVNLVQGKGGLGPVAFFMHISVGL